MTSAPLAPLRLGVLGCGRVFQRFHLPAIRRVPTLRLVAGSDSDPGRRSWAEQLSPSPVVLDSYDGLLSSPIDALLVLTPPPDHAEASVRALEAGLHVLVEKPMALTPADGSRMVSAARRARRRLQVGFSRRFRGPYQQLRSHLARDPNGVREVRFELAFPSSSWKATTDFLGNQSLGGGVLDDVLSHQADLVCWLFGRPVQVRARQDSTVSATAELRFPEFPVHCRAAHAAYVELLRVTRNDGSTLEASGSRFRVTRASEKWARPRARLWDRTSLVADRVLARPNTTLRSFESQLRDFEHGVRGGSALGATGEDGLGVVEIIQACRTSGLEGGKWQGLSPGPAG